MFATDRHRLRARGPWSRATTSKRARLNAMRHVLSLVDYTHKDHEIVGIPDPLIVGPASQVFEHGERPETS